MAYQPYEPQPETDEQQIWACEAEFHAHCCAMDIKDVVRICGGLDTLNAALAGLGLGMRVQAV